MARLFLTDRECDRILALPKLIRQNVVWAGKAHKSWATCSLEVRCTQLKGKLEMILTASNELPHKYSFTLLLNGAHSLRSLDVNGNHHNKCTDGRKWVGQTHKHMWSDSCPGGRAYTPPDITGPDMESAFGQFCTECGVAFEGQFVGPTSQPELRGM